MHAHVCPQHRPQHLCVRLALDVDVQRRDDRVAVGDDRVAGAVEELADRLRVDVDGLDAQHVVAAAADADARAGAAAGAGRGPDGGEVAGAVAEQRGGLAMEVGPHELALDAVLERQRLGGLGVDDLEQRVLLRREVEAVGVAALAGHRRPHVAHPEGVGDGDVPEAWISSRTAARPAPGSPAVTMWRSPRAVGSRPSSLARLGQVGGEAERAEDRGDAEAGDQVEQPLGLADSDRDDRGTGRLDRHVVGDAAGVERVVEAVGDRVRGEEAGDPERLAADRGVGLVVALGQPDRDRLAGRAGGDVEADEVLGLRAQVLAERRLALLARAQLVLGQERDLVQLAAAADALRVERRAGLQVGELVVERAHAATCTLAGRRARAASSPATTSAAPAIARAVIASS